VGHQRRELEALVLRLLYPRSHYERGPQGTVLVWRCYLRGPLSLGFVAAAVISPHPRVVAQARAWSLADEIFRLDVVHVFEADVPLPAQDPVINGGVSQLIRVLGLVKLRGYRSMVELRHHRVLPTGLLFAVRFASLTAPLATGRDAFRIPLLFEDAHLDLRVERVAREFEIGDSSHRLPIRFLVGREVLPIIKTHLAINGFGLRLNKDGQLSVGERDLFETTLLQHPSMVTAFQGIAGDALHDVIKTVAVNLFRPSALLVDLFVSR